MNINNVFSPIIPFNFLKQNFNGRKYQVIRGDKGKFAGLLTWDKINHLMNLTCGDYNRFKVFRDGEPVSTNDYLKFSRKVGQRGQKVQEVDRAKLVSALQAGATVIFDQVDKAFPDIGELGRALELFFDRTVGINAYVSWPGKRAFDVHWDVHDVIALQVYGEKEWHIFGETETSPLPNQFGEIPEPDHSNPIWSGVLKDGDAIYIPRGCWHSAEATEERSVHLTCGIQPKMGGGIFQWAIEQFQSNVLFRNEIPLDDSEAIQSMEKALLKEIREFFSPGILQRYDDHLRSMSTSRTFADMEKLTEDLDMSEYNVRGNFPRIISLKEKNGIIEYAVGGRIFKVSSAIKGLLEKLLTSEKFHISEFQNLQAEQSEINMFLNDLNAIDLIVLEKRKLNASN